MPNATPSILFTSESVTEGHPDKLSDAIADALLDDVLADDPEARCAIEVATTTGLVLVLGEVTTRHWIDVQEVVRRTVREIGYTDPRIGFDWESCGTLTAIEEQSPDIALGVDHALEAREGVERDELGPATRDDVRLRHRRVGHHHADADPARAPRGPRGWPRSAATGRCRTLRPDGKSQVTVESDADGHPRPVHTVLVTPSTTPMSTTRNAAAIAPTSSSPPSRTSSSTARRATSSTRRAAS